MKSQSRRKTDFFVGYGSIRSTSARMYNTLAASTQAIAIAKAMTIAPARSLRPGSPPRGLCAVGWRQVPGHRSLSATPATLGVRASTWRMRASTRSMTSSGVEVPAVSPTTVAASNHSGRTSASVCT